jgi:hypothetical protein
MQRAGALEGRPWKKAVTLYRYPIPRSVAYPTPLPCTATLHHEVESTLYMCVGAARCRVGGILHGKLQGRLTFIRERYRVGGFLCGGAAG